MKIETFEMMRMQCLYEREVEFDLSETTVLPLRVSELLDGGDDVERFIANELKYPESQGSQLFRERIAQFYMNCAGEYYRHQRRLRGKLCDIVDTPFTIG